MYDDGITEFKVHRQPGKLEVYLERNVERSQLHASDEYRPSRYFCYHIMPGPSSDGDKPELTMKSLSSKFIEDPIRLGSMQGNWKFILVERSQLHASDA